MARLRGKGQGSGIAIGVAAVVRSESGVPIPPAVPASIAKVIASRKYSEALSVILVAEEYLFALAIAGTIRWAEVAGIVAQNPASNAPSSRLPAVSGVRGILDIAQDDQLLLLDATNGVVLADPDPIEIARYQAEYERIAPRQRIFLEEQHLPVKTSDGKQIQVIAQVAYPEDVDAALKGGADCLLIQRVSGAGLGFFMAGGSPLLPANATEKELTSAFRALLEISNGKPLLIPDSYDLASPALLAFAQSADATLLLAPRTDLDGLGLAEYREALEEVEAECVRKELPYAMPALGVEIPAQLATETDEPTLRAFVERIAERGAVRLLVNWEAERFLDTSVGWLESLCAVCGNCGLPVFIELPYLPDNEESVSTLRAFVGAGVAGVVVLPEYAHLVKSEIRAIHANDCREVVLRFLQETASHSPFPFREGGQGG